MLDLTKLFIKLLILQIFKFILDLFYMLALKKGISALSKFYDFMEIQCITLCDKCQLEISNI